jgi:hypothetical protein
VTKPTTQTKTSETDGANGPKSVGDQIDRFDDTAFTHECSKLDPLEEQALADFGLSSEGADWSVWKG